MGALTVLCLASEDMDQPFEAHARGQLEAHIAKTEKSEKRKEETLTFYTFVLPELEVVAYVHSLKGPPSPGERRSESRGEGQGQCGQDIAGTKLLGSSAHQAQACRVGVRRLHHKQRGSSQHRLNPRSV